MNSGSVFMLTFIGFLFLFVIYAIIGWQSDIWEVPFTACEECGEVCPDDGSCDVASCECPVDTRFDCEAQNGNYVSKHYSEWDKEQTDRNTAIWLITHNYPNEDVSFLQSLDDSQIWLILQGICLEQLS